MHDPQSSLEGIGTEQRQDLLQRCGAAVKTLPYHEIDPEPEWDRDAYEYLVEHPWLLLADTRPIHICTVHPRQELLRGRFESQFRCPGQHPSCPWMRIVQTHGALTLRSLGSDRIAST